MLWTDLRDMLGDRVSCEYSDGDRVLFAIGIVRDVGENLATVETQHFDLLTRRADFRLRINGERISEAEEIRPPALIVEDLQRSVAHPSGQKLQWVLLPE